MEIWQLKKRTILKIGDSLTSKDHHDALKFWEKKLEGLESLQLTTDYPRSGVQNYTGGIRSFEVEKELCDQLEVLPYFKHTTFFITLLAALKVLLYRYLMQEDICILASVVSEHDTLPVRTKMHGEISFKDLVQQLHSTTTEALRYQQVHFDEMVEKVFGKRDLNRSDLCGIMFSFQEKRSEDQLVVNEFPFPEDQAAADTTKTDIVFLLTRTFSGLDCSIKYNTQLFKKETIDRMAGHYNELLKSIVRTPEKKIAKLDLVSGEEKFQLLCEFGSSTVPYPENRSIIDLFEEQVEKNPDKIAVIFEKEQITYDELNKRSNQLARFLISKGIRKEKLVPICLERRLEMIVAMLGILKAGAAYVPIDPEYPLERVNYILEDTDATIVVTGKAEWSKMPNYPNVSIVEIDGNWTELEKLPVVNLYLNVNSRNLAYVIYTSGSTGKPKGVMVEHQPVLDHCFGLIKSAQLQDCSSFALFSPLVFDAGHSIIFTSILLGASLHVLSKQSILDGEKLADYLDKSPVDCIKIVPSVWLSYVNENSRVIANKAMIFGGEMFSKNILEQLVNMDYRGAVYNHYGPTEATIGKCIHKIDLQRSYNDVPIGKPFSNTQLYIVDEWNQIVPIGVTGELFIAGEGLAREYLHRPDLTAEKFITNPFYSANSLKPEYNKKVYKTGDKARWNSDGEIEYLGRTDEQVKIDGHRIELGGIENVLVQLDQVKQAAVVQSGDAYGNKLVAYVVVKDVFNKQKIISRLQKKLPKYMIPGFWVELAGLPLTPNGKVNKKALPKPDFPRLLKTQYSAPRNKIEQELANIFKKILGVQQVGIHDTFFELGGNSIQAVSLFRQINKKFSTKLYVSAIFLAPDVEKLAAVIAEKQQKPNLSSLVPIQPYGNKKPLFCIHAGAGNVLFYYDLANNLGPDQPLYGLQARGLNGKEQFHTCIEDMASYYIQEIRTVQPEGPYQLLGYCLGGVVAFEMAQQLTSQGQQISFLASINGKSPTYREINFRDDSNKEQQTIPEKSFFARHFEIFQQLPASKKIMYPFKMARNRLGRIIGFTYYKLRTGSARQYYSIKKLAYNYYFSRNRLLPSILRYQYLWDESNAMAKAYKPGIYPGSIIVFRSPHIFRNTSLGWDMHVSQCTSYDVVGDYKRRQDVMTEPYIIFIADKIKIEMA